jgi:hypothetical protein
MARVDGTSALGGEDGGGGVNGRRYNGAMAEPGGRAGVMGGKRTVRVLWFCALTA